MSDGTWEGILAHHANFKSECVGPSTRALHPVTLAAYAAEFLYSIVESTLVRGKTKILATLKFQRIESLCVRQRLGLLCGE